jgi:signal transduction histidine kinase
MINELLDEAQIEARTVILRLEPFSPASILKKVESSMAVLARNKGLGFTASLAPDVPEMLIGDEHRLQQILINLTGNAIKFTKAGQVDVSIYRPNPSHWAIKVSDTGAGISQEAQSYIFEPFRQVDNSITRENRGTGLGLSITKQLVELMDGQITVHSEVDMGSVFTVLLPIVDRLEKNE